MKTRRIGRNGPEVSALGIGAMSFSNFYGETDEARSHAILDAAREVDVTHIDTANVYGMGTSETAIGTYFAKHGAGLRDGFHIATKAAITRRDGKRFYDNTLAHLESELDQSLARLGTDHVDLFYVHRRNPDIPIEEVAGFLGQLKAKGKTRGIGFSEIAPTSLRRAASEHHVDAVQSEYSLSTRAPELGLVQTCAELGATLVAFSPVGRSLLTDDPIPLERASGLPWLGTNPRFLEPNYSANLEAVKPFRALASDMGLPAAGLAIAWVLAQGEHVTTIPGTRSVTHFMELVAGWERVLTPEELKAVEEALPLGWAHGDRYSEDQWVGPERYC